MTRLFARITFILFISETILSTIPELPNAGLVRRLAAIFYDFLLITALWMMLGGLLVFANGNEVIKLPILPLLWPLVIFVFYLKFWHSNGQTLGMQTWRIKIVDRYGGKVSVAQCFRRCLAASLSWLALGLGYWWMLWDKDCLTWHDRLSGTRIIALPKASKKKR